MFGRDSSALPTWKSARDGTRRHMQPWPSIDRLFSSRFTQMRLFSLMALSLLITVSVTFMVWQPNTTWIASQDIEFTSSSISNNNRHSEETQKRKEAVREAMKFVWQNYHDRAWGADEIKPVNGVPFNPWGRVGCMILDSLDTLWIMDLKDEFEEARQWVHDELSFDEMGTISFFETVIRSIGGLLGAYDLSKDAVFLAKAVELTNKVIPAIDPTTGRATYYVDTRTNYTHQAGTLAESGTYQLEFEYLSMATGDPKYKTLARKFYPYLRDQSSIQLHGLFANEIYSFDIGHKIRGVTLCMGASGDSFYEYLLKVWILTKDQQASSHTKQMYLDAIDGMEQLLLDESRDGQLFVGEYSLIKYAKKATMHHLACFIPGMLALGARHMEADDPHRSERHVGIAKRLMKTCYQEFYAKQITGLAPECVLGKNLDVCPNGADYKLRPEVVESLYVLYQMTGDPTYQEWGWQIFSSIQRHCKTKFGYSAYRDVTKMVDSKAMTSDRDREMWAVKLLDNRMETFFTAETLKYLYLLLDPDNKHVSLATHVFNTEAHPLSIPTD